MVLFWQRLKSSLMIKHSFEGKEPVTGLGQIKVTEFQSETFTVGARFELYTGQAFLPERANVY